MMAISLWQPWASLWVCCRKPYETRHWATNHRGQLAVHAAKKLCADVDDNLDRICREEFGANWRKTLPRGAILGAGQLIACHRTELLQLSADAAAQGNFLPGRYAWEMMAMKALPAPIPYTGRQGLFQVPDEVLGLTAPPAPKQGRLL